MSKHHSKRLQELEERFDRLTSKLDNERQQEREYETTSFEDFESKIEKFELFLKTRRDRMKQESNLINLIKDPQN